MDEIRFEKILGVEFHRIELLHHALTHSSYCREHDLLAEDSNERLEFLGDAFLDAITGAELYRRLPTVSEGRLTKTRALVVCEKSLAKVGRRLKIGEYMEMGNGEERSGGRTRESIVADAVEAVIGAIYLDSGYETAKEFVIREFNPLIEDAIAGRLFSDYKTEIQEILQRDGSEPEIRYEVVGEKGPDHDKTFYVNLLCNGNKLGSGLGKTKKEAEQNAAKDSIEKGLETDVLQTTGNTRI